MPYDFLKGIHKVHAHKSKHIDVLPWKHLIQDSVGQMALKLD